MSRQNHGVAADYYAVGIIAYELMMGRVSNNLLNSNDILIFRDHTLDVLERTLKMLSFPNRQC